MEMKTEGTKLNIGDKAPEFRLQGIDDKEYSLEDFKDKEVFAVVFMCNHCPYVQAYLERLMNLQRDFADKVQLVGINANDENNYPEDSFEKMKLYGRIRQFNFPYLRDAEQSVAKAFDAQCTPEAFVFDKDRKLRYHGRIDDNYRNSQDVKSPDLRNAIEALLKGEEVEEPVKPAVGCSIKWSG